MLRLSKILSVGIPYLRTDFYSIGDRLYFGELTFYHGDGLGKFTPKRWNDVFGSWIPLPPEQNNSIGKE